MSQNPPSESRRDPLADVDTASASAVSALFHEAARLNHDASCREGSVDVISGHGRLLATGDLHDNPLAFARVVELARLDEHAADDQRHLTLHEVVHSERLMNGMDFSHRALLRVAAMKIVHPHQVHTLLANHELAQIAGAGITKDGMNVVKCFNEAVDFTFGDEAHMAHEAIGAFIRSMPLALRVRCEKGDVLCAHSLPGPDLIERFDPEVLERPLEEEDYTPRRGSAHIMVWGRRHTPELLRDLADRFGVGLFVLGHEKAEQGWLALPPNAVILNSDHARGAALPVDLSSPPAFADLEGAVQPLHGADEQPPA